MCERRGGLSQSGHWRLSMSDEANKAEQIATSTLTAVIYGAHAGSMGNEVGTDWVSERISLAESSYVGKNEVAEIQIQMQKDHIRCLTWRMALNGICQ